MKIELGSIKKGRQERTDIAQFATKFYQYKLAIAQSLSKQINTRFRHMFKNKKNFKLSQLSGTPSKDAALAASLQRKKFNAIPGTKGQKHKVQRIRGSQAGDIPRQFANTKVLKNKVTTQHDASQVIAYLNLPFATVLEQGGKTTKKQFPDAYQWQYLDRVFTNAGMFVGRIVKQTSKKIIGIFTNANKLIGKKQKGILTNLSVSKGAVPIKVGKQVVQSIKIKPRPYLIKLANIVEKDNCVDKAIASRKFPY